MPEQQQVEMVEVALLHLFLDHLQHTPVAAVVVHFRRELLVLAALAVAATEALEEQVEQPAPQILAAVVVGTERGVKMDLPAAPASFSSSTHWVLLRS